MRKLHVLAVKYLNLPDCVNVQMDKDQLSGFVKYGNYHKIIHSNCNFQVTLHLLLFYYIGRSHIKKAAVKDSQLSPKCHLEPTPRACRRGCGTSKKQKLVYSALPGPFRCA